MTRTLLLVHAHPDDEVLGTGATMAKYAAEGARVVLVTCTLGELGEVVVEDLAHLHSSREDRLGPHRITELTEAGRVLGVAKQYFLGGEGRFRDSNMMGMPDNDDPRSFWQADVTVAAEALLEILREEQPDVLITYDSNGGYGHPDHIKAHLVVQEALKTFDVPKVYEPKLPRSVVQQGMDVLAEAGQPGAFFGLDKAEDLPFAAPDEIITTIIDGSAHADAKTAAMKAHRSQLSDSDPLMMLAALVPDGLFGVEAYQLVRGTAVGSPETDLFAGL